MHLDKDGDPVIEFHLDGRSGVAPYLQLIHQVRHALRLGLLHEGDQLPKVKDVAAGLAINPNTVLKAYRQLEHEGLAGGRPGQGTFITGTLASPSPGTSQPLRASLEGWFRDAAEAGLSEEAITALIAAVQHEFRHDVPETRGAVPAMR
jgi:GntR family transcriptional regulator